MKHILKLFNFFLNKSLTLNVLLSVLSISVSHPRRGLFYVAYFMNPYIESIRKERKVVVRLLAELPKTHDAENCFINSFVDVKQSGVLSSPFFVQLRSLFKRQDDD